MPSTFDLIKWDALPVPRVKKSPLHQFLVLLLSALSLASAREQQQFSNAQYLRDHAETRGFMLGRPGKSVPTPDGKAVLFLRAQARVPTLELHEFDVATGQSRVLLTPAQVLKGA
jgi:dipeptidyl-peptidase-4